MDHQGGKKFGQLKAEQSIELDKINEQYYSSGDYDDVDELQEKLLQYKDIMELKQMMEKLGQAKTHLELKKMIAEVDTTNSGTINYNEFLTMMLGKKNSILKIILMFEEKKKAKELPKGPPPKKSLADLP